MPKMKTKKSAAKRFRVRPGGTVKRGQAFKRHILTKKSTKTKRHLRGAVTVHDTNMRSSLLGSLIEVLRVNLARKQTRVRVFELGKVFWIRSKKASTMLVSCTPTAPRRWRFIFVDFFVRMWRLNAWPRLTVPPGRTRNRLAALFLEIGRAHV